MQDPFLGQIAFYPYDFAPLNWTECAGQILPISQYAALFALLGTMYGGNGTSNFALPDLRGRVAVGQGQFPGGEFYDMGMQEGVENVSLQTSTMPAHNHPFNATNVQGTVNDPSNAILASAYVGNRGSSESTGQALNPGTPNTTLLPTSLAPAGSNLPHNNLQPSLVLRPCIALVGVFPPRT